MKVDPQSQFKIKISLSIGWLDCCISELLVSQLELKLRNGLNIHSVVYQSMVTSTEIGVNTYNIKELSAEDSRLRYSDGRDYNSKW